MNDAERAHIVMMPAAASLPGLSKGQKYLFRLALDEGVQFGRMLQTLKTHDIPIRNAGIIYVSDEAVDANAGTWVYPALMDQYGIRHDDVVSITYKTFDVSPQIARLLQGGPDVITVAALTDQADRIVHELRRQGFAGRIIGSQLFADPAAGALFGKDGDGVLLMAGFWWKISPEAASFNQKFIAANAAKGIKKAGAFHTDAQSYDIVHVLAAAMTKAGTTGDADRLDAEREGSGRRWSASPAAACSAATSASTARTQGCPATPSKSATAPGRCSRRSRRRPVAGRPEMLRGKAIAVVGGADGIGRAVVARLLRDGARVAVIGPPAATCRSGGPLAPGSIPWPAGRPPPNIRATPCRSRPGRREGEAMAVAYDPWIVALSVFVAIQGTYVALGLTLKIGQTVGLARRLTLAAAAFTFAVAIWSMHFVGMLAVRLPVQLDYLALPTLLSLLVSVFVVGVAVFIASLAPIRRWAVPLAAAIMGLGIATMHYIGMLALHGSVIMHHDPRYVLASFAVAVGASALGLRFAFVPHPAVPLALAACVLGGAISGMHYVAMAGMTLEPLRDMAGRHAMHLGMALSPDLLAVVVALVAFVVSAVFLLTLVPDHAPLAAPAPPTLHPTSRPAWRSPAPAGRSAGRAARDCASLPACCRSSAMARPNYLPIEAIVFVQADTQLQRGVRWPDAAVLPAGDRRRGAAAGPRAVPARPSQLPRGHRPHRQPAPRGRWRRGAVRDRGACHRPGQPRSLSDAQGPDRRPRPPSPVGQTY